MSYINSLFPVEGATLYELDNSNNVKYIHLEDVVPEEAYQVIVYATLTSGRCAGTNDYGELILSTTIPNGCIERKLYCHLYEQSAWSYNSENIAMPLAPGNPRILQVNLNLPNPELENVFGSVKVIGYRK